MSDSVQPHGRQPTRLPCPWDSPGKNTGAGCPFFLQCMKVKSESEVTQSCPTLSDPMDCSLPGSSIHGIFQARVLEWGAIAFSALYYFNDCRFVVQSESGSLIPPALFFFLMIALTLHGLLYFHTNYKILCSNSVKNTIGSLSGVDCFW